MGLKFPVEWKFDDLQEAMPARAVTDFHELVTVIASGCPDRWRIFETFKSAFGRSAGSSSESWAESDSEIAMSNYAANAPKFIDALWMGIDGVRSQVGVPSHDIINAILSKHGVPLKIDPPNLVLMRGDITVLNNGTSS